MPPGGQYHARRAEPGRFCPATSAAREQRPAAHPRRPGHGHHAVSCLRRQRHVPRCRRQHGIELRVLRPAVAVQHQMERQGQRVPRSHRRPRRRVLALQPNRETGRVLLPGHSDLPHLRLRRRQHGGLHRAFRYDDGRRHQRGWLRIHWTEWQLRHQRRLRQQADHQLRAEDLDPQRHREQHQLDADAEHGTHVAVACHGHPDRHRPTRGPQPRPAVGQPGEREHHQAGAAERQRALGRPDRQGSTGDRLEPGLQVAQQQVGHRPEEHHARHRSKRDLRLREHPGYRQQCLGRIQGHGPGAGPAGSRRPSAPRP